MKTDIGTDRSDVFQISASPPPTMVVPAAPKTPEKNRAEVTEREAHDQLERPTYRIDGRGNAPMMDVWMFLASARGMKKMVKKM